MTEIPIEKAVEIALEQHQAGNFKRAETLYLEILRQDPGNVDAMHLLGVLAHQGHEPALAVQFISAAIRKRPDAAMFHYNLADALHALHRDEEAIASYRKAIELEPDYFAAHNNLANVATIHRDYKTAEAAARRAMELDPGAPGAINNLGNALRGQDRFEEAVEAYEQAIKLEPQFAEAFNNLGMALSSLKRFDEAGEKLREAIRLRPTMVESHNNLGAALMRQGKFEEAGGCFQTVIDMQPEHAEGLNNLGAVLRVFARNEEALPLLEKAVAIKPAFAEARSNLAQVYNELGRKQDALKEIDEVIKTRPDSAREHFTRGTILRDMLRFDEAIDAFREALRLEPDHVSTITALGWALQESGDLDEAMASLKRSIELKPDPLTHSNVLMTVNYHPGYSQADLLEAHKSWAELHETPLKPLWPKHTNDRSPERRIRIGYVSPDMREHSVKFFLEPILENHDHTTVEVFAFAHLKNVDMNTWRFRTRIDQWRETSGQTPKQMVEQIHKDQIDILIDLAGHTANNSLHIFALKPAPIQVNMIGFPSTTGLSSMDYRITDERCDPVGMTEAFNTETLLRLPDIFWCFKPEDRSPPVGPLPADRNGFVTLTSVNNLTKITPAVQATWARIMAALPGSRLIMQTNAVSGKRTQAIILERFAKFGVTPDRIDFRPPTPLQQYLELLTNSDLTLDPFPFNGGTTTCHSLWMGAPVISLAGTRHAARMGLSMLSCIGLPELCAQTEDQYVDIAVKLAKDPDRLRAIRAGMRQRMLASPLLDGPRYVRNLEAAYRNIWRKWCETGV